MQVVLATAGYDHTVRFWEATSGICYRTLQHADSQVSYRHRAPANTATVAAEGQPRSQVNKLEITADKQILAAAGNPQIRLFEVNTSNPQPTYTREGHSGNVTALGFQRDSKWMFSGSEDGTVKIWDMRAPGFVREFISRAPVNTVVLHPNQGELISGKLRTSCAFRSIAGLFRFMTLQCRPQWPLRGLSELCVNWLSFHAILIAFGETEAAPVYLCQLLHPPISSIGAAFHGRAAGAFCLHAIVAAS